ncbi:heterogeneous nuclear ribonucleoprotein M [Diabrotica virgifera virgifera]|uniref:Heterogeneous nuclear ribonucleoprotein M-like n=1 Tax=Diabrotica virgifera virgifera TaxID=50390 RepID=A0A6P7FGI8_DIAVI|nr:heterogeneous nuclear ribonucleoprotein M [Diabrotica virgifera virgifera]
MTDTESNNDRGRRDNKRPREDSFRDRSRDRGNASTTQRSTKPSQTRVFVSNIPYEYRWQDVKDIFRNEVGDVSFVELFYDESNKSKGTGIVEFADKGSVDKCMEKMQRYEVNGRKLVVRDDSGVTRDRTGAILSGTSRRPPAERNFGGGGGGNSFNNSISFSSNNDGNWGNTYGLSPQFLESLKIDPPLVNRVFIANLEYNVDEKKLRDAFKLAGRIVNIDLPLDKDGRIRGFAVIEYDHPVEAVQAISMFNHQSFFDRTLAVRMDRANDNIKLPEGLRSIGMGLGPNGEPLKCVAHNLNNQSNSSTNGLLGAVPNNTLQQLSSLTGLSALNALQSANLGSLLGNNLGSNDLSSLVSNSLGGGGGGNPQPFGNNSSSNYNSQTSNYNSQSSNLGSGNSYHRGGGDDYQSGGGNSFGGGGNYGNGNNDGYNSSNSLSGRGFQNSGNISTYTSDRLSFVDNTNKTFSKKVLISNLPSTLSYNLLNEKCQEFGDVQGFETKGQGSVLLTYASDWQAEKAIKNLDKARIDGRMIDARLYF